MLHRHRQFGIARGRSPNEKMQSISGNLHRPQRLFFHLLHGPGFIFLPILGWPPGRIGMEWDYKDYSHTPSYPLCVMLFCGQGKDHCPKERQTFIPRDPCVLVSARVVNFILSNCSIFEFSMRIVLIMPIIYRCYLGNVYA